MPRSKQNELPALEGEGVAAVRWKDIDAAADKYVDIRDERMKQTQKEVEARGKLIEKMREHGLSTYRYGDHEVELKSGKDGVKVKCIDGTETEEEED